MQKKLMKFSHNTRIGLHKLRPFFLAFVEAAIDSNND